MSLPIGLTGGIATGKSTVSAMFRELGALTLSGDKIAADLLVKGSEALQDLVHCFGDKILTPELEMNRSVMLQLLLDDKDNMRQQLTVLAPHILPAVDKETKNLQTAHPGRLIIVEAPLLYEYGQRHRFSSIVVVTIPRSMQIQRLMKRSGRSQDWAANVVDLQIPTSEKTAMADYVIRNDGDLSETRRQVESVFTVLKPVF